jgi:hypothetical protein
LMSTPAIYSGKYRSSRPKNHGNDKSALSGTRVRWNNNLWNLTQHLYLSEGEMMDVHKNPHELIMLLNRIGDS